MALKAYFEEAKIPDLELLRSPINTGFGGGNMYGIPYAKATYLAIVNNDTLFKNDCLTILKETLDKNKKAVFIWFVFFWSLYGVFSTMSYTIKNTGYNILDIFAKNFFGLFLAYVIKSKSTLQMF